MPLISVAVDYVAYLRNIKGGRIPDPSHAAVLAELGGADSICAHLREDRMHIRDRDIYVLKEVVKTRFTVRLAPDRDLIDIALEVRPWMVTLVPFAGDKPFITGGLDFESYRRQYTDASQSLKEAGIKTSFLVEPQSEDIKNAARLKAEAVEINCYDYVNAKTTDERTSEIERIDQMSRLAAKYGMMADCGGGLDYTSVSPLAELESINEMRVGHAVCARGLLAGFAKAVTDMAALIK